MTDRPTKMISIDKLRYRWAHPDFFSEKETAAFTAGYRIAEHRLRFAPDQVHDSNTEFDKKLSALHHSIEKDGLKNPLIVKEHDGLFYCIVGNQRLAVLRGLATHAAASLRASIDRPGMLDDTPAQNRGRPLTQQEADSRISVPCIIALSNDSWNDWTEARLSAEPLDASGECSIGELRYRERLKYALLYEKDGDYRMGERRKQDLEKWIDAMVLAEDFDGLSWLDVGCGRGETREIAKHSWILKWHGVEVIESLADPFDDVTLTFGAHDLGFFADKSFDIVTCCDVLEHILEGDTLASLKELIRVTRHKLYLAISWEESSHKDVGELHINRHLREWWLQKLDIAIWKDDSGGLSWSTLDDMPDSCTFVVTR